MNLPNKLTILRVIMIPIFLVLLLWLDIRWAATVIFIAASLTDLLDGYIARSQNLVTNFGKFADPLADKLLVAAALISFVELKELSGWVVIVLISREFIVTGLRLLAVEKGKVLAAGFSGKLKTATQMVMIVYLLINFSFPYADIIKNILVGLSVLFSVYSAVEYIIQNKSVFDD